MGKIWSLACFHMTHKLRMTFTFLNNQEKLKGWYFMRSENYIKFEFQCPYLKLYWDTAGPITYLLSMPVFSFNREGIAHKTYNSF